MKTIRSKKFLIVVIMLITVYLPLKAEAILYNFGADWSDTDNSPGPWSYNQGSASLQSHTDSWGELGVPAWYNNSGSYGIPVVFKSDEPSISVPTGGNLDLENGDTGVHGAYYYDGGGPVNLTWTSPISGTATVSGQAWMLRNIGRAMTWNIYVDGTLQATGDLYSGDAYSRNSPFYFQNGEVSGGDLTGFPINIGTVIKLEFVHVYPYLHGEQYPDYAGFDFTVNAVPLPPSALLLGSGLAGLLALRGWRRRD